MINEFTQLNVTYEGDFLNDPFGCLYCTFNMLQTFNVFHLDCSCDLKVIKKKLKYGRK